MRNGKDHATAALDEPHRLNATTAVRRGSVCYTLPLPTKSIDVVRLPTKCGGEQTSKASRRKLATRNAVYPNKCRQRIV